MKLTTLLIASAVAFGGFALMNLQGQTPAVPNSAPAKVDLPLGRKCIVSVDPQASRESRPAGENAVSGFEADGTAKGQLIRLSDDWCVLKEGNSENWIPTDKILMIHTSD
ncbi:hypothetical protein OKA05_19455 [Luteolibacter arcticus]|uniref:SH3 domain-containing protein n=2 Tax=Luteolibacter arcticus TaxID=1581411 RepID=A0ABT3GMK6_9BACT|nr:hypothetical protein [Luteolibacter arcticus]